LIPHLAGKVKKLVGVDASRGAIEIVKRVASEYEEIRIQGICSDMFNIESGRQYDLIISSNSILPKTRINVIELYEKVKSLLKPTGKFIAILPSF
jgi:SAM-dependent methyltransferase